MEEKKVAALVRLRGLVARFRELKRAKGDHLEVKHVEINPDTVSVEIELVSSRHGALALRAWADAFGTPAEIDEMLFLNALCRVVTEALATSAEQIGKALQGFSQEEDSENFSNVLFMADAFVGSTMIAFALERLARSHGPTAPVVEGVSLGSNLGASFGKLSAQVFLGGDESLGGGAASGRTGALVFSAGAADEVTPAERTVSRLMARVLVEAQRTGKRGPAS